jgi:hypothetical protein
MTSTTGTFLLAVRGYSTSWGECVAGKDSHAGPPRLRLMTNVLVLIVLLALAMIFVLLWVAR